MPTEYVKPLDMIPGHKYILEPYDTSGQTMALLTGFNDIIKILMSSSHRLNNLRICSSGNIILAFEPNKRDKSKYLGLNTYALPDKWDQLFMKQPTIEDVYNNKIKDYEVRQAYTRMTRKDSQRDSSPAYLISEYAGFAPLNTILTMDRSLVRRSYLHRSH
jgi:hypothetical protein